MSIDVLRVAVSEFASLVGRESNEEALLAEGRGILAALIANDDWLPSFAAEPSLDRYRQYLLYGDPLDRFSIVSFVWGPGQHTPVHDHTVWGLVGVLRGEERARTFERAADGRLVPSEWLTLPSGTIEAVSPRIGDIHQVANGLTDRPSISIHVYGANIGRVSRHTFNPDTGTRKVFVSGYDNSVVPNLWPRAA